jgi:hypothetical protein
MAAEAHRSGVDILPAMISGGYNLYAERDRG